VLGVATDQEFVTFSHYHPSLASRGLENFREGTPSSREVIGEQTLDFRANFKFSRLNFFG